MSVKSNIIIYYDGRKIAIFFPEPNTVNSERINKFFILKNSTNQKWILFQE